MSETFQHAGGDVTLDVYPCTTQRHHKVSVKWPGDSVPTTFFYLNPNSSGCGPHEVEEFTKNEGTVEVTLEWSPTGTAPWYAPSSTGLVTTWHRRIWAESDPPPVSQDKNDANVVIT
jgi:hypothetical protein